VDLRFQSFVVCLVDLGGELHVDEPVALQVKEQERGSLVDLLESFVLVADIDPAQLDLLIQKSPPEPRQLGL
jgi:hypothetical protein